MLYKRLPTDDGELTETEMELVSAPNYDFFIEDYYVNLPQNPIYWIKDCIYFTCCDYQTVHTMLKLVAKECGHFDIDEIIYESIKGPLPLDERVNSYFSELLL
jgi:hypothetical protein